MEKLIEDIVKVCGPDFEESDIPSFISKENRKKLWEMICERREDERFDFHPRLEDVN